MSDPVSVISWKFDRGLFTIDTIASDILHFLRVFFICYALKGYNWLSCVRLWLCTKGEHQLKVDMPILTCIFFTNNWLTLTSEMHFVKFHPEVASCLLSRGKRKNAPLGMRLIWKYIRNYFLVYQLISHFLSYFQNYEEFKAKILDL